jgi:hypothetical protein
LDDTSKLAATKDFMDKHVKLNKPTLDYINNARSAIRPDRPAKILAVKSRGTDYTKLKPAGHHIQPDPSLLIERSREIMRENNYEYVFLFTEEKKVRDMFGKEFGARLLSIGSDYYDEINETSDKKWIVDYLGGGELARYRAALEFMAEIVIASRCDYLLGGINNGSIIAAEFNGGKYEGKELIDIGRYSGVYYA